MIAGALAAAAHRLGADGAGVLARFAGALGGEVRAAADELSKCDDLSSKRLRADWIAWARTPVPAGLRSIHPTWLEAELAGLPPRSRAAVAAAGGNDPVDVWLARWATAKFVAMPAVVAAARLVTPADLGSLDSQVVLAWLGRVGADQLAYAVGAAAGGTSGSPSGLEGFELPGAVRQAAERIRRPPRVGHLGALRAAIARCDRFRSDLVRIGASAVAPYLTPVVRQQVIARLPFGVGAPLGIAFDSGALTPLGHCPTWTALVAD